MSRVIFDEKSMHLKCVNLFTLLYIHRKIVFNDESNGAFSFSPATSQPTRASVKIDILTNIANPKTECIVNDCENRHISHEMTSNDTSNTCKICNILHVIAFEDTARP